MTHNQIREKFRKFFESKDHKWVASSSLLPDDPSVLFTTAGMQQFKPYFMGTADPVRDFGGRRTASIQKAFRTSDIDEVGDKSHLTFFEMLGHFSFGDYFKNETIEWTYLLLTDVFKISPDRISATVFAGDEKIPFDKESYEAWSKFLPVNHIRKGPRADNVWGPASPEGPCGAANEVYVDDLEAATLVFMEFYCDKDQNLAPLPQKGVDVGWGFERLVKITQDKDSIFETDLFEPLLNILPKHLDPRTKRIAVDHARAVVFLASEGVVPSNKEQGYVMRRLMRRIMAFNISNEIIDAVINTYAPQYPELKAKRNEIFSIYSEELAKFNKTIRYGLSELKRLEKIGATEAFRLYESFGLPFEVIKDTAKDRAKNLTRKGFDEEFKKHQEKSRAGAEKKFGGHGLLLDTGELKAGDEEELKKATRLHTATHLLHASLRKVLGEEVKQAGSDITAERLRFDFTFPRKLTPEEVQKVEDTINDAVKKDYQVTKKEMAYEDAIKSGALAFFKLKYPSRVNVYTVGPDDNFFSRELCGGPHVSHTAEIGRVKIIKEEAISAGTRRIRAVVE